LPHRLLSGLIICHQTDSLFCANKHSFISQVFACSFGWTHSSVRLDFTHSTNKPKPPNSLNPFHSAPRSYNNIILKIIRVLEILISQSTSFVKDVFLISNFKCLLILLISAKISDIWKYLIHILSKIQINFL